VSPFQDAEDATVTPFTVSAAPLCCGRFSVLDEYLDAVAVHGLTHGVSGNIDVPAFP
jgi:hypothetical protein